MRGSTPGDGLKAESGGQTLGHKWAWNLAPLTLMTDARGPDQRTFTPHGGAVRT
jgi:hypothetical protein